MKGWTEGREEERQKERDSSETPANVGIFFHGYPGFCTTPTPRVCILYPRRAHNTNCLLARIAGGLKRYENHPQGGGMEVGGAAIAPRLFFCLFLCLFVSCVHSSSSRSHTMWTTTFSHHRPVCRTEPHWWGQGGSFPYFQLPPPHIPKQKGSISLALYF